MRGPMDRLLAIRDDDPVARSRRRAPRRSPLDACGRAATSPRTRSRGRGAPAHLLGDGRLRGARRRGRRGRARCLSRRPSTRATSRPRPLGPGEAARIFTGATLPDGADAVVREEATRAERGARPLPRPRRAGRERAARRRGRRARRRSRSRRARGLARARRRCSRRSAPIAVPVRRAPRVAILSTGDEVVSGRTPDSNGVALAALVARARRRAGAARRRGPARGRRGRARGRARRGATRSSRSAACRWASGTTSRRRSRALGADVRVHGVPMKPGKPFLFALAGGKPVLGLPGSPSACLVAFEVFARPALLALAGAARRERPRAAAPARGARRGAARARAAPLGAARAGRRRAAARARRGADPRPRARRRAPAASPPDAGDLAGGRGGDGVAPRRRRARSRRAGAGRARRRPPIVAFSGPSGSGKTRLLARLVPALARRGVARRGR